MPSSENTERQDISDTRLYVQNGGEGDVNRNNPANSDVNDASDDATNNPRQQKTIETPHESQISAKNMKLQTTRSDIRACSQRIQIDLNQDSIQVKSVEKQQSMEGRDSTNIGGNFEIQDTEECQANEVSRESEDNVLVRVQHKIEQQ